MSPALPQGLGRPPGSGGSLEDHLSPASFSPRQRGNQARAAGAQRVWGAGGLGTASRWKVLHLSLRRARRQEATSGARERGQQRHGPHSQMVPRHVPGSTAALPLRGLGVAT